ncbi:hypothetical protein XFF6992_460006 [Xanthomonas citri pv. fuscans]|nr:hypothetical protein XFF7767_990006 [Xanthomonas citri pv. fuscans]SOO12476.1 hypothetical protein XFF7766_1110007 [Xanthomonas citri pv. fuscans]SOO20376.1 hypothetical protein XFF6992_460006 [Xanthomonas citri pv. fuscans]
MHGREYCEFPTAIPMSSAARVTMFGKMNSPGGIQCCVAQGHRVQEACLHDLRSGRNRVCETTLDYRGDVTTAECPNDVVAGRQVVYF